MWKLNPLGFIPKQLRGRRGRGGTWREIKAAPTEGVLVWVVARRQPGFVLPLNIEEGGAADAISSHGSEERTMRAAKTGVTET
jgi:hypothetical protein